MNTPASWVLLRGLARESGHWAEFPGRLQGAVSPTPVLMPDLPGAGARYRERSPASLGAMVRSLRAELPKGSTPVALLGLSLGGMVAMEWAQRHPEEVACVVLINTSLPGTALPWERLSPEAWVRGLKSLVTRDPRRREAEVLALISNDESRRGGVLDRWEALARQHPMGSANVLRQLVAAATAHTKPASISVPVLLLASRADRLARWRCTERLARQTGWPVRYHDRAGHDLTLDDPQWVLQQIQQWQSASATAGPSS